MDVVLVEDWFLCFTEYKLENKNKMIKQMHERNYFN